MSEIVFTLVLFLLFTTTTVQAATHTPATTLLPQVHTTTQLVLSAVHERIAEPNGQALVVASTQTDPQIAALMKLLEELIAIYSKLLAEQSGSIPVDDDAPVDSYKGTQQTSLTIINPNGGENYVSGESVIRIKYKSSGITGSTIKAYLYSPEDGNTRSMLGIAQESGTLEMYLAKGDAVEEAGNYKITLCAHDFQNAIGKDLCDSSNNDFYLTDSGSDSDDGETEDMPSCTLVTDKTSYQYGETIVFTWEGKNATYAAFWQNDSGKDHLWLPGDKLTASGSQPVTANVIGNALAKLLIYNHSGQSSCSVTVPISE